MAFSLFANFEETVDRESQLKLIGSGNSILSNRIQINFDESNNEVYRQLRHEVQEKRYSLAEFRIFTDRASFIAGRNWVCPGGKLSYISPMQRLDNKRSSTQQLSNQSRIIFKGFYESDIEVAIQRIVRSRELWKEIEREFRILRELDNNVNFIRYFCYESDLKEDFVFIATELCLCSVKELCQPTSPHNPILKLFEAKEIIRQSVLGLNFLHQNNFVHRNVKPSSFLVKEIVTKSGPKYTIKITDFRLSRPLDPDRDLSGTIASQGWIAPESLNAKQPLHPSLDVFIMGCFIHYVLTGDGYRKLPVHPFGLTEIQRSENVPNSKYLVYHEKWIPNGIVESDAIALLKRMLRFDERHRPTLSQVLEDSYFQRSAKEFYPIYRHEKPGLCVIFNQEFFLDRRNNREGSSKDCAKLEETFLNMGFDVEKHHDLMAWELKAKVDELVSKKDFSRYGSFVVCLLSHGTEGAVEGIDSRKVNINNLKYKFSLEKCPDLYGKPKIFIVQACQGTLKQTTTGFTSSSVASGERGKDAGENPVNSSGSKFIFSKLQELFVTNKIPKKLLLAIDERSPPLMDFITIKATLPGFVSYRNKVTGSTFIQSLCRKLNDEYILFGDARPEEECRDLESILRGDKGVQTAMNWRIQDWDKRQTMQWEACLSKYIRFQRGSNVRINATATGAENNATRDVTDNVEDKYFYYVRPTLPDKLESDDSTVIKIMFTIVLLLAMLIGYLNQTTTYN